MTLKTSSSKVDKKTTIFNKTIFTKTALRFWPIWALYLVIMIITMPVMLYNDLRYIRVGTHEPDLTVSLAVEESNKLSSLLYVLDTNLMPILIAVFAIISAVAVYSYLYSARSCNMMHAFPVKRTELFATNYVTGLLFLIVPQVIVALLTMAICAIYSIPGISYVAIWLVFEIGMSFFFYSLAVFCCMLTGHFFAGFAFFFLFNLFYVVFGNLMIFLAEEICYGVNTYFSMEDISGLILSPLVYLSTNNRVEFDCVTNGQVITSVEVTGGIAIALYCIPAVILILLALLLYKRRHLECAAEMTAHTFVKPMTRWMVTIAASFGLANWFAAVFFYNSDRFIPIYVGLLIIASWIVFFILEMAINKKFKIFKKVRFLEWGICLALMLVGVGLLEGDAFGIEKRSPAVEETKGVIVSADHEMVITDADEIAKILQVHQEIINSKDEYEAIYRESEIATEYVSFEFVLNNGKSFERRYSIPVSDDYMSDPDGAAYLIRSLQEDTDSVMKSWLAVNYEGMEILEGTLYVYNYTEYMDQNIQIEKEQMEVLYQAMVKDIREGNTYHYFGSEQDREYRYLNCHISFTAELKEFPITVYDLMEDLRYEDSEGTDFGTTIELSQQTYSYIENTNDRVIDAYFDVNTGCEHTIQAMLDLGLIEDVDALLDQEEDWIDDVDEY